MKKWLLLMLGLVLISGCATLKKWLPKQDAATLAAELRLLERLLNSEQSGRSLDIPLDLGKELSKRGLR
jgi:uncharacterized protein YceK